MKTIVVTSIFILFLFILSGIITNNSIAQKANCDVNIYIANNSLFDINITIDGIGFGKLLVGKNKTFTTSLINETPKRLKVKVSYNDPDDLEPKSINYMTKKVECGQIDTVYVAFTK